MSRKQSQYNIAIGAAKQNAQTIARCHDLDDTKTRVEVMRAVVKRQLELLEGIHQDLAAPNAPTAELETLEAMARRLEDLYFDFAE